MKAYEKQTKYVKIKAVNKEKEGVQMFPASTKEAMNLNSDKSYITPRTLGSVLSNIRTSIGDSDPIGAIMMYSSTTAPENWLICDGSAISRTTYADLFAAIGTTFGSGDGSTTFNIPDIKQRMPVGYDPSKAAYDTIGKKGGEERHTLTAAELPNLAFAGSGHALQGTEGGSGHWMFDGDSVIYGQGQAHNNMPPNIVLPFIIRYQLGKTGREGPQGPQGEQGPSYQATINGVPTLTMEGSGTISLTQTDDTLTISETTYIHNQVLAISEWTITHNLSKHPAVVVIDSADSAVIGDITYLSLNQIKITFSAAFSGKAYLN